MSIEFTSWVCQDKPQSCTEKGGKAPYPYLFVGLLDIIYFLSFSSISTTTLLSESKQIRRHFEQQVWEVGEKNAWTCNSGSYYIGCKGLIDFWTRY